MKKGKRRKKFRWKLFLVLSLSLYLIIMFSYYLFTLPVKNIYITGTTYLTDLEIIELANLKNYPSIFKIRSGKISKKLKENALVKDVKITRDIFGKITINITENKPLFISRSEDKIYLSDGSKIKNNDYYLGLPILINYVPKQILVDFIKGFKKIDTNIIRLISEIEYSLDEKDNEVLDDTRFILRMNDTNTVYINIINLEKLNNYEKIYATIDDNVHGTMYLNSNRENVSFKTYTNETNNEN